jgi:hypothetical protein
MSLGSYQYTAGNGTVYSVIIPTDFATLLSMTAATTQPPLPAQYAPRYGSFTGSDGTYRQAIVQTTTKLASLIGTTYTISGVVYTCNNVQGESIPPIQQAIINGPYIIQGAPGTNGNPGTNGTNGVPSSIVPWSSATSYVIGAGVYSAGSSYVCIANNTNELPPNATYWQEIAAAGAAYTPTTYFLQLATDVAMTNANTYYSVFTQALPIGTYLIIACLEIEAPSAGQEFDTSLQFIHAAAACCSSISILPTNGTIKQSFSAICTLAVADTLYVYALCTDNNATVRCRAVSNNVNPPCASNVSIVKLA